MSHHAKEQQIRLAKETPYHMEYRLVDGTEDSHTFRPDVEEPEEERPPPKSPATKKAVERLVVIPSPKPEKVRKERNYDRISVPAQNTYGLNDILERLSKAVSDNTKVMKSLKKHFCGDDGEDKDKKRKDKVYVEVRASFIRIVDVDTINQRFYAEVYVQGKWSEPLLQGKTQEELDRIDFKRYWSPKLTVVNIEGDLDEDLTWFHAQTYQSGYRYPVVCFRRRMRGMFKEILELKHFPIDIQELTLQVTTERTSDEIELLEDPRDLSQVFDFDDGAEWKLYKHVDVVKKAINSKSIAAKYRKPRIDIQCHVARRPGFYFWNTFLLMFILQGLSFTVFAILPSAPQYRLMIMFLLLLSGISFKVNLAKNLPTVSYLTYLDIYVYATLIFLCLQAIESAVVSAFVEADGLSTARQGDKWYMIGMAIFIFLFNVIFLIYVIYVYRKGRSWLTDKDSRYNQKREKARLMAPIENGQVKMEPHRAPEQTEIILKPQETVYVVRPSPRSKPKKHHKDKKTAHLSYSQPAYRGGTNTYPHYAHQNSTIIHDPESTMHSNIYEVPTH